MFSPTYWYFETIKKQVVERLPGSTEGMCEMGTSVGGCIWGVATACGLLLKSATPFSHQRNIC
jgi:hypothetical protein